MKIQAVQSVKVDLIGGYYDGMQITIKRPFHPVLMFYNAAKDRQYIYEFDKKLNSAGTLPLKYRFSAIQFC